MSSRCVWYRSLHIEHMRAEGSSRIGSSGTSESAAPPSEASASTPPRGVGNRSPPAPDPSIPATVSAAGVSGTT